MHADGGHLPAIYPHSRAAWNTSGCQAELRQSIDDYLLDSPDVSHYVAFPFSQIHDRIADDLAGTVIRDVAAAVGGVELDAGAAQGIFARQQIFGMAIAPLRDYVR